MMVWRRVWCSLLLLEVVWRRRGGGGGRNHELAVATVVVVVVNGMLGWQVLKMVLMWLELVVVCYNERLSLRLCLRLLNYDLIKKKSLLTFRRISCI